MEASDITGSTQSKALLSLYTCLYQGKLPIIKLFEARGNTKHAHPPLLSQHVARHTEGAATVLIAASFARKDEETTNAKLHPRQNTYVKTEIRR
jgi:hypothetical protein